MAVLVKLPPCVLHEDEHILVVNKPPGWNTHAPSPFANEGIYEWLRHREPRWNTLAIIHRLDKATSGVMVFAKSKLANKALTEQFSERQISKTYLLLTSSAPSEREFTVRCQLARVGEKYVPAKTGEVAETRFRYLGPQPPFHLLAAEPITGRTHQIRAHGALKGLSIVGDTLYGGCDFQRVCLHSEQLHIQHPATGESVRFAAPIDFLADPALMLRTLLIEPERTNAFRLAHGGSDRLALYLDRWGDYLLAQSARDPVPEELAYLERMRQALGSRGVYHKLLQREVSRASQSQTAPRLLLGEPAPAVFSVHENGVNYEISFEQGYSVGLFLDQRDNRRRLLTNYAGADFELFPGGLAGRQVLNTFAYTCGFSVGAALAGATTTSLDLSKKYLEWGERNFRLNNIEPAAHDFIFGDVFDWAARLQKKQRRFDLILLDPPTFSRAGNRVFQAEKDLSDLISTVLPLIRPGGLLFVSTNAHRLAPEKFLDQVEQAVSRGQRKITRSRYCPQPPDFPAGKEEPAYLKTAWFRLE